MGVCVENVFWKVHYYDLTKKKGKSAGYTAANTGQYLYFGTSKAIFVLLNQSSRRTCRSAGYEKKERAH